MYFIQDVDRPDLFWAGECIFGELEFRINRWNGPKIDNDYHFNVSGDGVRFHSSPIYPFYFSSYKEAEDAIQYVPRKYNVQICHSDKVKVDGNK